MATLLNANGDVVSAMLITRISGKKWFPKQLAPTIRDCGFINLKRI
jgi:hypothetical protein